MGPGEDTKVNKAERVHHNLITTVRTKKRTYNVIISLTGIKVSHVVRDKKARRKHTEFWEHTWDDFDKMFDQ